MPSAQALFEEVLAHYASARERPFANHAMGDLLRHRLPNVVGSWLTGQAYYVNGSAGKGNWAETPWVAVFDPLVTPGRLRATTSFTCFEGTAGASFCP